MKPATSLCSLRLVAGTRGCTNINPATATSTDRQTTNRSGMTFITELAPSTLYKLHRSFGIGVHVRQRSCARYDGALEEGSRDHERTRLPGQGGDLEEALRARRGS